MNTIVKKSVAYLDANIGRCPRCLRHAFQAALGAWALTLAVAVLGVIDWALSAMTFAALGLTALWLTHLTAMVIRSYLGWRRIGRPSLDATQASQQSPTGLAIKRNRRQFVEDLTYVGTTAVGVLLLTSRIAISGSKRCAGNGMQCKTDSDCCPGLCCPQVPSNNHALITLLTCGTKGSPVLPPYIKC
jgi:hypothetical protein